MASITKKILLIALPLMLNACAYDVQHYIPSPYGVNVTPAPRVYTNGNNYQRLYSNKPNRQQTYYNNPPNYQQHDGNKNEHHHHDNGKHKGQYKNKHHDD